MVLLLLTLRVSLTLWNHSFLCYLLPPKFLGFHSCQFMKEYNIPTLFSNCIENQKRKYIFLLHLRVPLTSEIIMICTKFWKIPAPQIQSIYSERHIFPKPSAKWYSNNLEHLSEQMVTKHKSVLQIALDWQVFHSDRKNLYLFITFL